MERLPSRPASASDERPAFSTLSETLVWTPRLRLDLSDAENFVFGCPAGSELVCPASSRPL